MTALKSWATWGPGKKPEGARMKADVEMLLEGGARGKIYSLCLMSKRKYITGHYYKISPKVPWLLHN